MTALLNVVGNVRYVYGELIVTACKTAKRDSIVKVLCTFRVYCEYDFGACEQA